MPIRGCFDSIRKSKLELSNDTPILKAKSANGLVFNNNKIIQKKTLRLDKRYILIRNV